jgi:hypothetical protein
MKLAGRISWNRERTPETGGSVGVDVRPLNAWCGGSFDHETRIPPFQNKSILICFISAVLFLPLQTVIPTE